jgi:N-methylhydantoinase A
MSAMIGIDIGGTFTDLTAYDPASGKLTFGKTTTTALPDEGAVSGLKRLIADGVNIREAAVLKHGTTVVINSILERRGAKTALITTEGFRDTLEIGRGSRPESFNLFYRRLAPLVPRDLRFEIRERMSARGEVLKPLDRATLPRIVKQLVDAGIEAVAICFLHAYRNPDHELEVAAYIAEHMKCFVTCSHELSREFREFERTSTAVINAFVGPRTSTYVARFRDGINGAGFDGRLLLMGSNGGVLTDSEAIKRPVLLIESGPVGGAAGAAELGRALSMPNVIAFDMGGTTAKAVMIENGEAAVTPVYYAAGYNRGYPVQAAVLDIVEVGAGGGSIAAVNEMGALVVGPRSAGGVPGPVCYGTGGTEPTITDANLVLGRLHPDRFLNGEIKLDHAAAQKAIGELAARLNEPLHRVAAGIIHIATLTMASAVKMTTVERGHDPRDFAMIAYGGAGPLHGADIARELGIRTVIIPNHPGHFCAYGMLYADLKYDVVQTMAIGLEQLDMADAEKQLRMLEERGRASLKEIKVDLRTTAAGRFADMRYRGQEHTLKIRLPDAMSATTQTDMRAAFESEYTKRYGHSSKNVPVDLVNLRVVVTGVADKPSMNDVKAGDLDFTRETREVIFDGKNFISCAIWPREKLNVGVRIEGPAIIEESASTTVVGPNDWATIDRLGNIHITIGSEQ